jgi:hypothetical protein
MTLLPASSYAGAMRTLAGLLADIPFTIGWHVPAGKTVTEWWLLIPAVILEEIFWHAAGPLIGDDEPSAVMLAGMPVDAADGMLVNVADTKENRAFFGTTGTADGSSPFRSSGLSRWPPAPDGPCSVASSGSREPGADHAETARKAPARRCSPAWSPAPTGTSRAIT